jgi:hypothetical protein
MKMIDHKEAMRRISRARIKMLFGQPFFGSIAMKMNVQLTPKVKTMGVDGKNLFVNPEFLETLTEPQTIGVLCHEVLHIANAHHLRKGKRDHGRWNKACDFVINPIVMSAGMELPPEGLVDPKYTGKSAERVYGMLEEEEKDKPKPDQPEDGEGEGDGGFGEVLDGTEGMSDSEVSMAEQEVKVMVAEAAEAARRQGKLPASVAALVGEIIKPKVNWKEALRRFVSAVVPSNYSWARPNRRFIAQNVYLPGIVKSGVGVMVVGIDTSGSIYADANLTKQFLSEVEAICDETKPETVHVVFCDAAISATDTFDNGDMCGVFDRLKGLVRGGGGTDFRPVFKWVEDQGIQPAAMIYLTDMEGVFPQHAPPYPVLWAKTTDHPAPFGESVRIEAGA